MLTQVLKEIEDSRGAIRVVELSRKLNIETGVLEGMIDYWVRKGRIQRLKESDLLCSVQSCEGCMLYGKKCGK